MRVSREKAEENRQTVIDVASRLFRSHGFDGIGLKDLMRQAGLTQGAFYKQFESKEDLEAIASRRALELSLARLLAAADANATSPLDGLIDLYLSISHRADYCGGCPIVALGADAARQSESVKASFEVGIESHLAMLGELLPSGDNAAGEKAKMILSLLVGAMTLTRIVNDEELARGFLQAASRAVNHIVTEAC